MSGSGGSIEHMFDRLRGALAEAARGFDPALLPAEACVSVVDDLAAIERTAAHLKGLAAARVAETELWRQSGARSPEEDLARRTGTSQAKAKEQLETAKRMRDHRLLDQAARDGKLSQEQASAISDAAAADPDAEDRLVDAAGRESLRELRETCGRVKAAATDPEERHRRIKKARSCRHYTDADGAFHLHLRDTPDVGAAILAKLQPKANEHFESARQKGEREPAEAYAADALVELILQDGEPQAAQKVASRNAKVIVRIDWPTLVRGWPEGGEVCEVAGIGPVPVSVVEAMLASGDAFLAAVVTRGVDVLNVAHLGRQVTDLQRTALQWRDPCCTVTECSSTFTEIDHRLDWADSKITLVGLLDRLCRHHHWLKTRHGWALVTGSGKRPMVPPDDPRHPRFSQEARAG
jgi:hypothetical protein